MNHMDHGAASASALKYAVPNDIQSKPLIIHTPSRSSCVPEGVCSQSKILLYKQISLGRGTGYEYVSRRETVGPVFLCLDSGLSV